MEKKLKTVLDGNHSHYFLVDKTFPSYGFTQESEFSSRTWSPVIPGVQNCEDAEGRPLGKAEREPARSTPSTPSMRTSIVALPQVFKHQPPRPPCGPPCRRRSLTNHPHQPIGVAWPSREPVHCGVALPLTLLAIWNKEQERIAVAVLIGPAG